ncbi:hypothetical protein SELMODRAFT_432611, partial [Selaginella moellendorffii]
DGNRVDSVGTEGKSLGGELTDSEGAIAVRDLVQALVPPAAADQELLAQRAPAGDGLESRGEGRIEQRVRLAVAALARQALEPENIASGVGNHVDGSRRCSDSERDEVLATAVGEAGSQRRLEVLLQEGVGVLEGIREARLWDPGDSEADPGGDGQEAELVTVETIADEAVYGGVGWAALGGGGGGAASWSYGSGISSEEESVDADLEVLFVAAASSGFHRSDHQAENADERS